MSKKLLKIILLILFFIFSYCLISNAAEIGDINGDGNITNEDLDILRGHIVQKQLIIEEQEYLADLNDDEQITISDLSILKKMTNQEDAERTLNRIEIESLPSKKTYGIGEELDLSGLKVIAIYDNEEREDITSSVTTSGFNSKILGSHTINVMYEGKSTSFNINVIKTGFFAQGTFITKINIKNNPQKVIYKYGEELDLTGLVVESILSNGKTGYVYNYEVSGYNPFKIGNQRIVITYKTKNRYNKEKVFTTSFYVEVIDYIENINVNFKKDIYKYGENLEYEAIATYVSGNTEDITKKVKIDGYESLQIGEQILKISYTENLKTGESIEHNTENTVEVINYVKEFNTVLNKTVYKFGEDIEYTAEVIFANGEKKDVTTDENCVIEYDSSLIGDQVIKFIYTENLDKIAEINEFTKELNVKIIDYITSISISNLPTKITYNLGENLDTTGLSINAIYASGNNKEITDNLDVTGYDSQVEGIQTLTVTYIENIDELNEQNKFTTTFNITVSIPVESVTLNKSATTLIVGSTETLVATITPSNATNKNVTWSSSDTSVATVDSTGKVTGVNTGTATITVMTEDGSKIGSCTVTVVVPVTGVTLNESSITLNTGKATTGQLTATIAPSNATNKNVSWNSSNTSVATVDSTGKITAVGVGTATITVTTSDGNKTANCNVTVESGTLNVLFIGNSKTYYNNFPTMFEQLANQAYSESKISKNVNVVQFSFGSGASDTDYVGYKTSGKALRYLCYYRTKTLFERIASQKWDYIVVQEKTDRALSADEVDYYAQGAAVIIAYAQSGKTAAINALNKYENIINSGDSFATAKSYMPENNNTNSNVKLILDAVQVRIDSSNGDQTTTNQNNEAVKQSLINNEIRTNSNVKIAYTGSGFIKYKSEGNSLDDLYYNTNESQTHQSVLGSYLRACTVYTTIFGKSSEGIAEYGKISGSTDSTSGTGPTTYCANPDHNAVSKANGTLVQQITYNVQKDKSNYNDGAF